MLAPKKRQVDTRKVTQLRWYQIFDFFIINGMSVNHRHRVVHSFLKGGIGVLIIARASCYFSAASANKIDSFAD